MVVPPIGTPTKMMMGKMAGNYLKLLVGRVGFETPSESLGLLGYLGFIVVPDAGQNGEEFIQILFC